VGTYGTLFSFWDFPLFLFLLPKTQFPDSARKVPFSFILDCGPFSPPSLLFVCTGASPVPPFANSPSLLFLSCPGSLPPMRVFPPTCCRRAGYLVGLPAVVTLVPLLARCHSQFISGPPSLGLSGSRLLSFVPGSQACSRPPARALSPRVRSADVIPFKQSSPSFFCFCGGVGVGGGGGGLGVFLYRVLKFFSV